MLQVHQDLVAGTAHISSVSDFPLTQPCLSFAIMEACTKRFKQSPNDSHLDEITTGQRPAGLSLSLSVFTRAAFLLLKSP